MKGTPLSSGASFDAEAQARWAQAAWALLGEERPNVLEVWREANAKTVRPETPPDMVDSFSRRQERIRNGEEQATSTRGGRSGEWEASRRALRLVTDAIPDTLPEPEKLRPQPGSLYKLVTKPVANRVKAKLREAPPIPIGSDHVSGTWFRELVESAGMTLAAAAEAASIPKTGVGWIVRDARGPVSATRRLALLRAVRRLSGHLYSEAEWDYLEVRTIPVPIVHCVDCRTPLQAGSVKARLVCPECAAKRAAARAALPEPTKVSFKCAECGKWRYRLTRGTPAAFRPKYCGPCATLRRNRLQLESQRRRRATMTPGERELRDRNRRLYYLRKHETVLEQVRQYSATHREEIKQRRERLRSDPDFRRYNAQKSREWREANKLRLLTSERSPERRAQKAAAGRRFREANRDSYQAYERSPERVARKAENLRRLRERKRNERQEA